jgi:hypothetical protein
LALILNQTYMNILEFGLKAKKDKSILESILNKLVIEERLKAGSEKKDFSESRL